MSEDKKTKKNEKSARSTNDPEYRKSLEIKDPVESDADVERTTRITIDEELKRLRAMSEFKAERAFAAMIKVLEEQHEKGSMRASALFKPPKEDSISAFKMEEMEAKIMTFEKRLKTITRHLQESKREKIDLLKKIDKLEQALIEKEEDEVLESLLANTPTETDLEKIDQIRDKLIKRAEATKRLKQIQKQNQILDKTLKNAEIIITESSVIKKPRHVVIIDPKEDSNKTINKEITHQVIVVPEPSIIVVEYEDDKPEDVSLRKEFLPIKKNEESRPLNVDDIFVDEADCRRPKASDSLEKLEQKNQDKPAEEKAKEELNTDLKENEKVATEKVNEVTQKDEVGSANEVTATDNTDSAKDTDELKEENDIADVDNKSHLNTAAVDDSNHKVIPVKEDSSKEIPVKEDSPKEIPVMEDSSKEIPVKEDSSKEIPVKENSSKDIKPEHSSKDTSKENDQEASVEIAKLSDKIVNDAENLKKEDSGKELKLNAIEVIDESEKEDSANVAVVADEVDVIDETHGPATVEIDTLKEGSAGSEQAVVDSIKLDEARDLGESSEATKNAKEEEEKASNTNKSKEKKDKGNEHERKDSKRDSILLSEVAEKLKRYSLELDEKEKKKREKTSSKENN